MSSKTSLREIPTLRRNRHYCATPLQKEDQIIWKQIQVGLITAKDPLLHCDKMMIRLEYVYYLIVLILTDFGFLKRSKTFLMVFCFLFV